MAYRHTQYGTGIIIAIALGVLFILSSIGAAGVAKAFPITLIVLLGIALMVFYSMTVEIDDSRLECCLGPGFIRKSIPLSTIDSATKVQLPWYSGWGIRWMPGRYSLWRISGFQAVELALTDGSRFRIGTNDPDNLVKAIQESRKF